ncbi:hypothetical protein ISN75_12085 [Dyella marensis]|uniref:YciI family protein n=1 Tax=Dyella marensis TaxID=500610 RepID=UPI0031CE4597
MLYVVTLTYLRAQQDIQAHLGTHRDWLIEHARAGRIIAAGPLETGDGGAILAHCESRSELDDMLERDSFRVHGLAQYGVQAFDAALRAQAFPAAWAPAAKAP